MKDYLKLNRKPYIFYSSRGIGWHIRLVGQDYVPVAGYVGESAWQFTFQTAPGDGSVVRASILGA